MANFLSDKKNSVMLIGAACLLLTLFVVVWIVKDIRAKFRAISQQTSASEEKFVRLLGIRQGAQAIQEEHSRYKEYLPGKEADVRVLSEALLRESERIAKEAGVSIINLSPQGTQEAILRSKILKVDLRMEGTPEKVMDFVRLVENSRLLIRIIRLSLSAKDESAALLKGELTIELALQ